MAMPWAAKLYLASVLLLAVSVLWRPVLLPRLKDLKNAPRDDRVGLLAAAAHPGELAPRLAGRRLLVVGGTRGVGRGLALAAARAGASVTVAGRSEASARETIAMLEMQRVGPAQAFASAACDLGARASATRCVDELARRAAREGKFDFVACTAAVWPDWDEPLQADGLEKGHFVAVVGRYMLYRRLGELLTPERGRVLNVAVAGMAYLSFDRALASGAKAPASLQGTILNWATANDLMLIGLAREDEHGAFARATRATTHPGLLVTDLHRGQGWLMDVLEPLIVAIAGISEQEAGERQASVLVSPSLRPAALTYVSDDLQARLPSPSLLALADEHLDWLMALIRDKSGAGRSEQQ
jgi:hypothetical protein